MLAKNSKYMLVNYVYCCQSASIVLCAASTQMSTSVQRTTEVVTRKPSAETQQEVGHAHADQDSPEMDSTVQVVELFLNRGSYDSHVGL